MTIQECLGDLDYVNAKLAERMLDDDSFLGTFFNACLRADSFNFPIIRPALHVLMQKYPADPKLLANQRRDGE
jgi:hypothetical protein